ncbi:MAG: hypothetical protein E7395_05115 [Ruminococcaceae bacterium]|nr:hypothetical protein [Oscillospiraceae bacterium]
MKISEVDTNFKINPNVRRDGMKLYDCMQSPFKVYGIFKEGGRFRRMPEAVAKSVSEGVCYLHTNTAGGRVRFCTDSPYIAISAKMDAPGKMPHFAFTGSIGFDLYADDVYFKTFVPPMDITDGFDSIIDLGEKKMRDIIINFPLYSNVIDLYIGLDGDAVIGEGKAYVNEKPAVFYGSSITQGGCASRPGTCYQGVVSRRFNMDYINLGFSGNAKGEDEMIDYIKNLYMSLFVLDYDYNAPSPEHLNNTHEKLFKAVRENHKDIPIIIMSRPRFYLTPEEELRRSIVETTYKNALASGDKNVYFLDGKKLCELCGNEGNVDGCHPTDFGFASMAKAVGDVIEKNHCI